MEGSTLILTVEKGPRVGETIECVTGSEIKIGRIIKGNTFTIRNPGISTNHLLIKFKDSKWVISDLDSSNGTILNEISLQPMTDYDLTDEDVIKIGERTSLKVKIVKVIKPTKSSTEASRKESVDVAIEKGFDAENGEEYQLKRNTRRGVASRNTRAFKEEPSVSLASIPEVEKVPANPNPGLDNCVGRESVASVAGTRPRRGRPRKAKDEPETVQKISEISESDQEIGKAPEVVNHVGEKRTRRGAPRRVKGSKVDQFTTSEVQKIPENKNADPVNCTEVSKVAEKSGLSKEDQPLESVSYVQKGLETLSFDHEECRKEPQNLAPIEKKQTRRVAQRRAKASQDEPLESVQIPVPVPEAPENDPKQSNLQQNLAPIEKKQTRRVTHRRTKASQDEPSNSDQVPAPVPEASENDPSQSNLHQDFHTQSNLKRQTCKEPASTSASKENLVPENHEKVEYEIDLEKMTLGQWFDYLEVYLPKQLHEITDEIIASMRERSKQFNEFMLQQQGGKGKNVF